MMMMIMIIMIMMMLCHNLAQNVDAVAAAAPKAVHDLQRRV